MTTDTPTRQLIIDELNANLDAAFTKSVNTLFDDIINYLRHQTAGGRSACKYIKQWIDPGTMMSPVCIEYATVVLGSDSKYSSKICSEELDKLLDAVNDKLKSEKIIVLYGSFKYITADYVNYTLVIKFDLEVPPVGKPQIEYPVNSPSHSPETNEFDFKCGSC